ncbi:MAG: ABC transporter ATP-binding protein/permease [Oscillospiraceae bacterium]|jgi:ATP-binding cassette subfamily B multidrug efflux pump|nr:ABC transporter ATP-binding protein/permease [Oscillospiraceae bacterium]
MGKVMKYFTRKEKGMIALSMCFIVVQVWLDLKLPDYMSDITTLVETKGSSMSAILTQGGYMLLCALGSMAASMVVGYLAAKVAAGLAKTLRGKVYDKTLDFSMEEINRFSTASLINRTTNDITQIQTLVAMGLQAIVKAPILAVWAIVKIAGKSWQWTTATAVAVFVLILMLAATLIFAVPRFRRIQGLTDNLNRITREHLTGIRVVRAYNAEAYQQNKFGNANDELTQTNLIANRVMAIMSPGMTLINSGLTLAVYWIGAYLIEAAGAASRLTIFSQMVVFSNYAMQVIMAFMLLNMIFILLPRAQVSAKRISEVLNTKVHITDGADTQGKQGCTGTVAFRHVSFRYPGAGGDVLTDISFEAKKGETVAFIGATGSGKSTLINLIPRFYDATKGEVLVDGINVKQYQQAALRDKLGYIPQKAVLFSGTVCSNVSYGEKAGADISAEGVKEAVSIAQSTDFVEQMEGTYDAAIAQGGTNVSGGQKQRLAIARAIARKPEILIFDDSFSALDYKTDRALRHALSKKTKDITKLIVAQRIGTIRHADQILVLDHGRVVGKGTHEELLSSCAAYQEIAASQLSKEELKNV